MARPRSSARLTLVTPTDEPPFTGLTKSGSGNGGSESSTEPRTATARVVGMPASRRSALKTALSMPTADAVTPAPT